ncbi:MAG: hypothetical protein AAF675_20930 [Pseudomonadota bacterium]
MTGLLAFLALAVSTAALLYLRVTDPRRRRVFNLPPLDRDRPLLAQAALWLPAVGLILLGNLAALVIWMGGIAVIGWAVAAATPNTVVVARERFDALRVESAKRYVSLRAGLRLWLRVLSTIPAQLREEAATPGQSDRIAALEARIAELETLLAGRSTSESDAANTAKSPPLAIAGSRP